MTALGVEYAAKYTLTGPDGTIATFNDSTDPNFVGMLNAESSGLDGVDVREDAQDSTEADGGVHGNFYYSRRAIVLQGQIIATSKADRAAKVAKLKRAANALREDATLSWTDGGSGAAVALKVRKQQRLIIQGGWMKSFLVPLVSAYPFIEAQTATTSTALALESQQKFVKKYPGFQTVVQFGGGEHNEGSWSPGTSGIESEDGFYTVSEPLSEPGKMLYLLGSNYNFAIPTTATILGVEVGIKRKGSSGAMARDWEVKLVQNTALLSANRANTSENWPSSVATAIYGGKTDLWGGGLTPAGLNKTGANEAGVAFVPARGFSWTSGGKAEIDTIWMKVWYLQTTKPEPTKVLTNNGDEYAPLTITIKGAVTNPVITNKTTGKSISITGEIPAGSTLVIDTKYGTVKLNGVSAYNMVNFSGTEWWKLKPGNNTIAVTGEWAEGTPTAEFSFKDTYV